MSVFKGTGKGKEPNQTDNGAGKASKVGHMAPFPPPGGPKSSIANMCFPPEGQEAFFEKTSKHLKKVQLTG